ncbi:MAG: Amidohydrolase [Ilumatobacteraceae bacterium]|nr:Amidohydrolase [Ilumatobacteraceae bacterium]MCU1390145.1 Amidohydrolase [Ilumatobacteraceae bacterium]
MDGIGIVDLMIGFPKKSAADHYKFLDGAVKDAESKTMAMPAQYMFKGVPTDVGDDADTVDMLLADMDRCGVARGMVHMGSEESIRALRDHPDRIIPCADADPTDIVGSVRRIRKAVEEWGIKAVTSFPSGFVPQVPVNDRAYYPIYSACVELDLPIIINAGVPGPRVPMMCQHVELFDDVCYDFPELKIVMRHGAEPWQALAVKLMLKWPGLYYMTSAFAPKHYPKEIIAFANTRGIDKVMYAGYYPMGLSLDRIVGELRNVPFRDEVWPKFLRDNAVRVFAL